MADRNPKPDLKRGVLQKKLASEAYRVIGGVTRNSTATRAIDLTARDSLSPRRSFLGILQSLLE